MARLSRRSAGRRRKGSLVNAGRSVRERSAEGSVTELFVDGLSVRLTRKRVKNLNLRIARTGEHVEISGSSVVSVGEIPA